jgi:hypothetical protein
MSQESSAPGDGCTCDLEPSFMIDQGDDTPVDVVDAEGVMVASCPTRAYAELVAAALDAFCDDEFRACLVHTIRG